MTKDEIFAFLNANPVCYLATAEGDQPRVRGMMLFRADENGILFHSGEGKDMTNQLRANPKAEICIFNPEQNVQVRVTGITEFINDLAVKQQMVAERPFLQPMVEQTGYDKFIVFRIKDCVATVWTMANNMAPKTFVKL
ncbi:MAG: pyridoxamine 5'-phosphate oxidase family protein [Armatimonadota bacterium]